MASTVLSATQLYTGNNYSTLTSALTGTSSSSTSSSTSLADAATSASSTSSTTSPAVALLSSALSTSSSSSSSLTQLTQQLAVRLYSDEQTQEQAITDKYATQFSTLESQAQQWAKVAVSVKLTQSNIDSAVKATSTVRDTLTKMQSLLATVKSNGDVTYANKMWDQALQELNNAVNSLPATSNLMASGQNSSVSLQTGPHAAIPLSSIYLGTNYTITQDDGTQWQGNGWLSTLTSDKGDVTSTLTGVKLIDKQSDGSLTFQFDYQNDGPEVTGTLKTSGLGLMGSWYYDLGDSATQEALAKQLDQAQLKVMTANLQFSSYQLQASSTLANVEAKQQSYNDQLTDLQTQQSSEIDDVQSAARQKYQAMADNLEALSTNQAYYGALFGSGSLTGALGVLYSATV